MVEGIYRLVPGARVGHIGLYRDHDTLEPVDYYFKVPSDAAERDFFLLDPMLATGGSAAAAVASLKRAGATRIRFMCLVAAPEGVQRLAAAHPDVHGLLRVARPRAQRAGLHPAGLGDAGDRLVRNAVTTAMKDEAAAIRALPFDRHAYAIRRSAEPLARTIALLPRGVDDPLLRLRVDDLRRPPD